MYEVIVRLGIGIMKNKSSFYVDEIVGEDFFWNATSKLGIEKDELEKINPTYDDLLEIYSELKNFGFSTKYFLNKQKFQNE